MIDYVYFGCVKSFFPLTFSIEHVSTKLLHLPQISFISSSVMDRNGLNARLADLKTAEVLARRRGDLKTAQKVSDV